MLTDFTEKDVEKGIDLHFEDLHQNFADSYERIAPGIYKVSWHFDILGRDLLKQNDPFTSYLRDFYQKMSKYSDADYDTPEFKKFMADHHERQANNPYPSEEYGVCDYPEQVAEKWPILALDPRRFVITAREIRKEFEPEHDGWRWHKWGEYIGSQNSVAEYLADEPYIDSIFVYHIYELTD